MRLIPVSLTILALTGGLCFSCSGSALHVHTLCLEPPSLPPVWRNLGIEGFEIVWTDESGAVRIARMSSSESLYIRVRRGMDQWISAYPVAFGIRLLPAGFQYPLGLSAAPRRWAYLDCDAVCPAFEAGYAAEVAYCLVRMGRNPSVYPLEKLQTIPLEKQKDPWAVPPWKTAMALIDRGFRITAFPGSATGVELPPGREWWPVSPFCIMEHGEPGARALLASGTSFFISERKVCRVVVDEEGNALVDLVPVELLASTAGTRGSGCLPSRFLSSACPVSRKCPEFPCVPSTP